MARPPAHARLWLAGVLTFAVLSGTGVARAHIEVPYTLGRVIAESSTICLMTVTKVDKAQGMVIYQKVRDLKGKHPQDTVKHIIRAELVAGEIKAVLDWAEPGKTAVFFHNGSASETCTGLNWYQAYPQGEWWSMSHGEGGLLRTFVGKPEKLAATVTDILAGKEVLVPCFSNADRNGWINRKGRVQRSRASLKLLDYDDKRDFAGWGGEDVRRIEGMPGFSHFAGLGRADSEAQSATAIDFDGDGKLDLCLAGSTRVMLLQNQGDSFGEVGLPGFIGGCRSAVWADYNGDGKPDLLLATPTGPRLFANLGGGNFRDDSAVLPREACYNLTAAAWLDADGDGKPDILLGNGFHGLRLYRNTLGEEGRVAAGTPRLSDWHYIGPFANSGGRGFDTVYPPERKIDLKGEYTGKRGTRIKWKKGDFHDSAINNLALFQADANVEAVVYLYREIETAGPADLPVSLGSDDGLVVWLNGEKVLAENVSRACAPDQNKLTLKLKAGKNRLLLKVIQGGGEWAFYFAPGAAVSTATCFEDVSADWGLGPATADAVGKGDTLAVADVNGDGRPDFLYGAGSGTLFVNSGKRFEVGASVGIDYRPGKVGPVFVDFDGDGHPDLFVPQHGRCKLFRNDGKGRFTDVTDAAGDLAKPLPGAVSAAWGDFNNDGRPDLFVGCLRGTNRYFENAGNGAFVEKTDALGLGQRVFNTQAIAVADLNGDGRLDVILNNEGQDAAVLFANPAFEAARRSPVAVQLPTGACWVGGQVRILGAGGKTLQACSLSGGEGRGGQGTVSPRFALEPGDYRVEFTDSAGRKRSRPVRVGEGAQRVRWEDEAASPKP